MPVYFFDTEINGQVARDDEGITLPDLKTARRDATSALYGLASELEAEVDQVHATLRIRNEANDVVLALDMKLVVSAVAAHAGV